MVASRTIPRIVGSDRSLSCSWRSCSSLSYGSSWPWTAHPSPPECLSGSFPSFPLACLWSHHGMPDYLQPIDWIQWSLQQVDVSSSGCSSSGWLVHLDEQTVQWCCYSSSASTRWFRSGICSSTVCQCSTSLMTCSVCHSLGSPSGFCYHSSCSSLELQCLHLYPLCRDHCSNQDRCSLPSDPCLLLHHLTVMKRSSTAWFPCSSSCTPVLCPVLFLPRFRPSMPSCLYLARAYLVPFARISSPTPFVCCSQSVPWVVAALGCPSVSASSDQQQ